MTVYVFLTRDTSSVLSNLIRRLTGGAWSHCGLLFDDLPAPDVPQCFEMYEPTPPTPATSALHGPFDAAELTLWQQHDPTNRSLLVMPVYVSTADAIAAWQFCVQHLNAIRYGTLQLVTIQQELLTGWIVAKIEDPDSSYVCSELVARALPDAFALHYLHVGDWTYNLVCPDAATAPSIYKSLVQWNSDHPAFAPTPGTQQQLAGHPIRAYLAIQNTNGGAA